MIKANTLTFEQVEPAFHKWANYFSNNYFAKWELINSTWLYGTVRFLPQSKIKLASKVIKCDMIDYMRAISGIRRKSCFHNETDLRPKIEGRNEFLNTIKLAGEDIERKDLVRYLTSHPSFSRIEKLAMSLLYIEDLSQEDTARACGCSPSRISQIHTNIMSRLRALDYSKITG